MEKFRLMQRFGQLPFIGPVLIAISRKLQPAVKTDSLPAVENTTNPPDQSIDPAEKQVLHWLILAEEYREMHPGKLDLPPPRSKKDRRKRGPKHIL